MNTEIPDNSVSRTPASGWVLYDGDCRLCCDLALRIRPVLEPRGFVLAPLQTGWALHRLNLSRAPVEMAVLTDDGRTLGGADAVLHLAGYIWWARPLRWISLVPGMTALLLAGYQWIARHRHCYGGACRTKPRPRWAAWLPLVSLPPLVALFLNGFPAWIFMWVMALAIYAGGKWLTWWPIRHAPGGASKRTAAAYLLFWVGMDGRPFLNPRAQRPNRREWVSALLKTLLGASLIWGVVRFTPDDAAPARGWIGMVGMIFLLHFGLFHLLALFWNARGVMVRPLMNNPIAATSLAEFWGRRWNTGFHDLVLANLFRPLVVRTNTAIATLLTFTVSGLIHELVISVPAGAGCGWPTLYFVLQGCGALLERSNAGKRLGLGRGMRGWFFALLIAAIPVGLLFHPPFIHNVILPMLDAIGAT